MNFKEMYKGHNETGNPLWFYDIGCLSTQSMRTGEGRGSENSAVYIKSGVSCSEGVCLAHISWKCGQSLAMSCPHGCTLEQTPYSGNSCFRLSLIQLPAGMTLAPVF
jgi:hypothetical protein